MTIVLNAACASVRRVAPAISQHRHCRHHKRHKRPATKAMRPPRAVAINSVAPIVARIVPAARGFAKSAGMISVNVWPATAVARRVCIPPRQRCPAQHPPPLQLPRWRPHLQLRPRACLQSRPRPLLLLRLRPHLHPSLRQFPFRRNYLICRSASSNYRSW